VHIVVGVYGDVEIEAWLTPEVEAAGGDIGGDQERISPLRN